MDAVIMKREGRKEGGREGGRAYLKLILGRVDLVVVALVQVVDGLRLLPVDLKTAFLGREGGSEGGREGG